MSELKETVTISIANALGYVGKLFVKSYAFPEGKLKMVLTTEDDKELTFKVEVKNKEEENATTDSTN